MEGALVNPSFTRGEYWLLEAVVELPVPICFLAREGMEDIFNKKGHGMDRALLVETMAKLFNDGLIISHKSDAWDKLKVLTSNQIEKAIDDEDQINKYHFYRLTPKGGKYWEAFALPNWENYISDCYEPINDSDKEKCSLICSQKGHLKTLFNSLKFHEYKIEDGSIKWDVVRPWQATYWKELDMGHRVCFLFEYKDKEYSKPEPFNRCFYDMLWYRWR